MSQNNTINEFQTQVLQLRNKIKDILWNLDIEFVEKASNTYTQCIIHSLRKDYYLDLLNNPEDYGIPRQLRDALYQNDFEDSVNKISDIPISSDNSREFENKLFSENI